MGRSESLTLNSNDRFSPIYQPMSESAPETIHMRGHHLIDQLIAEQDDVIRQLDELDAKIEQTIIAIVQERERVDKSAA